MERVDQPPRTMPYRPSDAIARMYRVATGMSASCSGDEWPNRLTFGPMGITAKTLKAANAAMAGARK